MGQLINAVGHHTDRSSHQILRNLARTRACGCNLQHKRAENAERRLYQTIHRKDPNNYLFQRATHRRSKLGFFVFNHARVRPPTYRDPTRFETMPSRSIWQACRKMVAPSPVALTSTCCLKPIYGGKADPKCKDEHASGRAAAMDAA